MRCEGETIDNAPYFLSYDVKADVSLKCFPLNIIYMFFQSENNLLITSDNIKTGLASKLPNCLQY